MIVMLNRLDHDENEKFVKLDRSKLLQSRSENLSRSLKGKMWC